MGWLFKRTGPPKTLIQPQVKKLTKYVMTINDGSRDIHFYEFTDIRDTPIRRFETYNEMMQDFSRGISQKDLHHNLSGLIDELQSATIEGSTNALIRAKWLKSRCEIAMDIDLGLSLMSVAFFTVDENLLSYDEDIGHWKVKLFEKEGVSTFFLSEPVRKYWTLTNISEQGFKMYLKSRKEKRRTTRLLEKMGISTVSSI